ncbi:MAG: hypothetical protein ACRD7E_06915, partial [Bryobacteraceae bacterium]
MRFGKADALIYAGLDKDPVKQSSQTVKKTFIWLTVNNMVEEKVMQNLKSFAATSCLGIAALMFAPAALADQWNKKTILTVNETVQIPGAVLEPGKYVMKLMDSPSNRHVVQVFNETEDELQTTILAIPNYRLQPTGKTQFQWWETPAGEPKA